MGESFPFLVTRRQSRRLNVTDPPTGALILVVDEEGIGAGLIDKSNEENNLFLLEDLCV